MLARTSPEIQGSRFGGLQRQGRWLSANQRLPRGLLVVELMPRESLHEVVRQRRAELVGFDHLTSVLLRSLRLLVLLGCNVREELAQVRATRPDPQDSLASLADVQVRAEGVRARSNRLLLVSEPGWLAEGLLALRLGKGLPGVPVLLSVTLTADELAFCHGRGLASEVPIESRSGMEVKHLGLDVRRVLRAAVSLVSRLLWVECWSLAAGLLLIKYGRDDVLSLSTVWLRSSSVLATSVAQGVLVTEDALVVVPWLSHLIKTKRVHGHRLRACATATFGRYF